MDDDSTRFSSDPRRETRAEQLLRRLSRTLAELRRDGVAGPAAFEDLLARNRPARPPAR
jgi:hypothetical protein